MNNLCNILKVEINEQFNYLLNGISYGPFMIDDNGICWFCSCNVRAGDFIFSMIEHPEYIIHESHLTKDELDLCKATGARCATRDFCDGEGSDRVVLWTGEPRFQADGSYVGDSGCGATAFLAIGLLPNFQPGNCITFEYVDAEEPVQESYEPAPASESGE